MKRLLSFAAILVSLMIPVGQSALAQIPRTISYQGVLTDPNGAFIPDGNHTLVIRLYENAGGGSAVHVETQTVTVVRGVFNVVIGFVFPLPTTLTFDRAYFLGVSVDGGNELSPRTPMTAVPYALHSSVADALSPNAAGVVTSINGQDGAVTLQGGGSTTVTKNGNVFLISSSGGGSGGTGIQGVQNTDGTMLIINPNGPVTTLNIADGMVTSQKIADGTITVADIAAGVIPTSLPPNGKAGGDLTGTYPNPTIAADAVTSLKIAKGAVGSRELSDGGVITDKIADGSVTNPKFADGSVTNPKIADGSVSNAKITDVAWSKVTGAPSALPPNGTAGGDLNGSYPNPTVDGLQGRAVSSAVPSTGQVLKWNGTAWTPANDSIGGAGFSLPYSGSVTTASDAFAVTNAGTGRAGSFTASSSANSGAALEVTNAGTGSTLKTSNTGTSVVGLELGNGTVKVSGNNKAVFTASGVGDFAINNTLCNGDATALLLATATGNITAAPFSVYFSAADGRWHIKSTATYSITYNVFVIKQ